MTTQSILPPTDASLAQLARIQGDDRCVLTVYFPSPSASGKANRAKLAELPSGLLPATELSKDEVEHLRRALEIWGRVISGVELPAAAAWVGVVSWLTDEVAFMQLPADVAPAAYLDNSPFLLTAARMLDNHEAYGVVYADHKRAAIYLAALGRFEEEKRLRGDIKNHVRKGGWSQQRYERRRDKEIHVYCKAIVARLKELVEAEGLARIVLAGDTLLLNELQKCMSTDMRARVAAVLAMEDKRDPREVYEDTFAAAAAQEKADEERLLQTILNEHASGGRAVVGPEDTLAALRDKRVRHLLVGPMDAVAVTRCKDCGAVTLGSADVCAACGSEAYAQSAANEFMDLAFDGGSRVELTERSLADVGGVCALLRW
jgi:peptide subunit release factor 1 (eRF1)